MKRQRLAIKSDRYRFALDLSRYGAGNEFDLLHSSWSDSAHLLTRRNVALLSTFGHFATIDEHIQNAAEQFRFNENNCEQLRATIQNWVDCGLLVSEKMLLEKCIAAPSQSRVEQTQSDSTNQISSVCIPTKDRPNSLKQCIDSYLKHVDARRGTIQFLVADDSTNEENARSNAEHVSTVAKQSSIECRYLGAQEKQEYVTKLAMRAQVPQSIVEFALVPNSFLDMGAGANRNLLLLLTAGELVLSVDDDTMCQYVPLPKSNGVLKLSSAYDPSGFWFPDEAESDQIEFQNGDLCSLHETLLGRSVSQLIADRFKDPVNDPIKSVARNGVASGIGAEPLRGQDLGNENGIDLTEVHSGSFFQNIYNGDARIRLTQCGIAGDTGMSSPEYFLMLQGESLTRLIDTQRDYFSQDSSRQVLRGVSSATVVQKAYCMAMNLGLDNRALLPPFMPVGRNEDSVFATVLNQTNEQSYSGFLHFALRHRWQEYDRTSSALSDMYKGPHSSELLQMLIRAGDVVLGDDVAQNMAALGAVLEAWEKVSLDKFRERLRQLSWLRASEYVVALDKHMKGKPKGPWLSAARAYREGVYAAAVTDDYFVPCDFRHFGTQDDALGAFKSMVSKFGRLLQNWPAIYQAARELHDAGWRSGG